MYVCKGKPKRRVLIIQVLSRRVARRSASPVELSIYQEKTEDALLLATRRLRTCIMSTRLLGFPLHTYM